MEKLTYKQAYDKIIEAYFKDEINPNASEFCFCGTLQCGSSWRYINTAKNYTVIEYQRMEMALFSSFSKEADLSIPCFLTRYCVGHKKRNEVIENYEEKLFAGMCAALDVLKEIHRERGENVDELPTLTKRNLVRTK